MATVQFIRLDPCSGALDDNVDISRVTPLFLISGVTRVTQDSISKKLSLQVSEGLDL